MEPRRPLGRKPHINHLVGLRRTFTGSGSLVLAPISIRKATSFSSRPVWLHLPTSQIPFRSRPDWRLHMKQRYWREPPRLLLHIIAEKHIDQEVFGRRTEIADYHSCHGLGPGAAWTVLATLAGFGEKIISVERFFPLNRHLY